VNPFEGELIRLSAVQRDDIPAYVQWFRDYEVQRFLSPGILVPMTEEAEIAWYERVATSDRSDVFVFGIRTLAEDKLIGNCGLHDISMKNSCGTFGIFIGNKAYWSKGYGTDATRALLRFAFYELNLNRVQLEVYGYNTRAARAYEKAGFQHEGTRRKALFREGCYHDILCMGVLRDEWQDSFLQRE
jgi:RimJ/RimL family protein N-acetyltransferase